MLNHWYLAVLREGREQACARLAHDQDANLCAQLIKKDVAIEERVDKDMGRK
jgi:hypothetical protein